MTLDQAKQHIQTCAAQMHARYQKPVFDEWAVISFADQKGRALAYIGPRKEGFKQNFLADAGSLRVGLMADQYHVGDFEFTGMVSEPVSNRLCNWQRTIPYLQHTSQSMDAISKDPLLG